MNELLAHLVGDYLLQSHWMALEKVKRISVAIIHASFYSIPFLFLTHNIWALLIIWGTHVLIDRYRIANYVGQIKNGHFKTKNGYPEETPVWLATWLVIITDNTLHLLINHLALLIK